MRARKSEERDSCDERLSLGGKSADEMSERQTVSESGRQTAIRLTGDQENRCDTATG